MHRETARKYVAAGQLPSEMTQPRDWRTRPDPFEEHWPEVEARLRATPELEAKTLFELLQQQYPGRGRQLRTLQRHVKRWRAAHGPDREVVLAQQHRPGEAAQATRPLESRHPEDVPSSDIQRDLSVTPLSAVAQGDLLVSLFKLGQSTRDRKLLNEALQIARELERSGHLKPSDRRFLELIPRVLASLP